MNVDFDFSSEHSVEQNFYKWVNSNWMQTNPIPADQKRWGSFNIIDFENKNKIKEILETKYPESNPYHKLNILYNQGVDIDYRKKSMNEIEPYIHTLLHAKNLEELLDIMVKYKLSVGLSGPINLVVYNDFENSSMNILHLFTGGLGLPDRDYYFSDVNKIEREEYKKFMKEYIDCFGLSFDLNKIYDVEEYLAKYTYTKVEKRKPELQNNPMNMEEILKKYPTFTFLNSFFSTLKKPMGKINVSNPKYMEKLNDAFKNVPLQTWKEYLAYRFLLNIYSFVSIDVEKIYFNFYSAILSGTKVMKPLWKRSLMNTESQLGFLIGQCYVEKYFSEKAKTKALTMIKYIKLYLKERIHSLEWMSNKTKTRALEKLETMIIKIGYPEKWRQYKSDISEKNSYLKNNLNCNIDDANYHYTKLYNEIDRTEWEMYPQEVNAYYSPSMNEIVFPAGILQPPFFSEHYDIALNFGGIGTVIGHEITHGFDDQGCKFDSNGNLNNWWTEEDFENYRLKTEKIKHQYSQYSLNNIQVNGELTLGENIADLGGVTISLEGLKKYLNDNPNENVNIDNLTPNQRFFINYCRIWRCNCRDEDSKQRLLTDPHSPPVFRVNGVIINVDDFYSSFSIKETCHYFIPQEKRAKIW
jgi:putative endopeptidase